MTIDTHLTTTRTVTINVPIPTPLLDAAAGTPEKSDERYRIFLLGCELEDEVAYDDDEVLSVRRADAVSGESFAYELTIAAGVNPEDARAAALAAAEAHVYTHHVAYRVIVPCRRISGTTSIITPLDVAISADLWQRIKVRNFETGLSGPERVEALAQSIVDALEAHFQKL
jgi:hypothetical protein